MPKSLSQEFEKLITVISCYSDGVSIEELLNFFSYTVPKRTLQYRLSALVKAGKIKNRGVGRSSKYFPNDMWGNSEVFETIDTPYRASIIPFSAESLNLKKLISAPIQERRHVNYQKEFLYSYEPNKTFYLSQAVRERLLKLGSGVERGRPAGTYARKVYQRFLLDLSWNSSRLEGNSYSILETEKLLATGEGILGKDKIDTQMILNHKDAIEFIVDIAEELDIKRYIILNIHALLSNDLLLDPKACGRLRTVPVRIGKSVYHPVAVPQLIEEHFQLIIQKAAAIKDPFEQSFFLMVHLPYLQPFLDVNKRVSRLVGNIPFIRENLSPLSFVDVPQADYIQGLLAIYELNRIELFRDVFVWAYERSAALYLAILEEVGEPDPFRVRYRAFIRRAVYEVVKHKMNRVESSYAIQKIADENVPIIDQRRFVEIIEIELSSLHEGNFARFRIRPSEFFEWKKSCEYNNLR